MTRSSPPVRTSGHWRASVHVDDRWQEVRQPRGPYASGSLLEWGSITKGLVGTTAWTALDMERTVVSYLPGVPDHEMTVADLVLHTSGLPRLPGGMTGNLFRDPYRSSVGAPLDLALAVPVTPRGRFVYSNLGYALLGAVLDSVHGDWSDAVRRHVLEPAGIRSATLRPDPTDRVVPTLWGRSITPWRMSESPYASAGGVWSTFEDLCRYAAWALEPGADPRRTESWQRERGSVWINGEVRASGAAMVQAAGLTAVVHTLAQAPHAADRIAAALIGQELRRREGDDGERGR